MRYDLRRERLASPLRAGTRLPGFAFGAGTLHRAVARNLRAAPRLVTAKHAEPLHDVLEVRQHIKHLSFSSSLGDSQRFTLLLTFLVGCFSTKSHSEAVPLAPKVDVR